jgi:hypothetical protein
MGKGIVILLVLIGFVLALGLIGSDLVNPIDAVIRLEDHRAEQANLNSPPSQEEVDLQAAQNQQALDAQRARDQADLVAQIEMQELEIKRIEAQNRFFEYASYMALLVIGFGLLCGLTLLTARALLRMVRNNDRRDPPPGGAPPDDWYETSYEPPIEIVTYRNGSSRNAYQNRPRPVKQAEITYQHRLNRYEDG